MLQLILVFVSLKVAFSLPKRKKRKAEDYPGVDPEKFQAWHQADLRFARAFPWIAVGGLVVQQIVSFLIALIFSLSSSTADGTMFGIVGALILFFISVGWLQTLYSAANSRRKEAGIDESGAIRAIGVPFLGDVTLGQQESQANAQASASSPAGNTAKLGVSPEPSEGSSSDSIPSGY